jgi:hypothetical protein
MSAIPSAVAHTVLKNFMIISGTAVGSIYAVYQVFNIATRKEMAIEDRGHLKIYNTVVHPEQDKLYAAFLEFWRRLLMDVLQRYDFRPHEVDESSEGEETLEYDVCGEGGGEEDLKLREEGSGEIHKSERLHIKY